MTKTAKNRKEELLDELLKDCKNPEDITGENGLLKQLVKGLMERALDGELTHHLGYEKHAAEGKNSGNSRNGTSEKKLKTNFGEVDVRVPRDRKGGFEPRLVRKYQTRFNGFDEQIISMYARGMTTRDIATHLKEIYGVDVSADFISQVTNTVSQEVADWQGRPLDKVYSIVYLDALMCKVRDDGQIRNKAVYLAIGINLEGHKEILGMWIQQTEGAKFWHSILNELKNRGIEDVFFFCVDGLKGFSEAIESVFPHAIVQLCIVHMVRNSMRYVSWKDRKQVARDLKQVYRAANEKIAQNNLDSFVQKWDNKYATIGKLWRRNWDRLIPYLDYPSEIRRVIYTTNAIESLNMSLRKVTKNRGHFPSDESCLKIMYLALKNASKNWNRPVNNWGSVMNQMHLMFENRIPIG